MTITVQIEPGAEPISGLLIDPDGTEHAFSGWLALIAALDAASGNGSQREEER